MVVMGEMTEVYIYIKGRRHKLTPKEAEEMYLYLGRVLDHTEATTRWAIPDNMDLVRASRSRWTE